MDPPPTFGVLLVQVDVGTLATLVLVVVTFCSLAVLLALCCSRITSHRHHQLFCGGCHRLVVVQGVTQSPHDVVTRDHYNIPHVVVDPPPDSSHHQSATFQRLGMRQVSPKLDNDVLALESPTQLSESLPNQSPGFQPLTPSPIVSPVRESRNLSDKCKYLYPGKVNSQIQGETLINEREQVYPFKAITDCERNVTSRRGETPLPSPADLPIASADQFVTVRSRTEEESVNKPLPETICHNYINPQEEEENVNKPPSEYGYHNYIHPLGKAGPIPLLASQSDLADELEISNGISSILGTYYMSEVKQSPIVSKKSLIPTSLQNRERYNSLPNERLPPTFPSRRHPSHPPSVPILNRRRTISRMACEAYLEEGRDSEKEPLI